MTTTEARERMIPGACGRAAVFDTGVSRFTRRSGRDEAPFYFFLNSASKAARPGLTFSPGGAAGPGLTMRRPVASRTVSGLKDSQGLAAVLEVKRFGVAWPPSKPGPGG